MPAQNLINKLSAVIIDDEFHGRENLKVIIEAYCNEVTILGMAGSVTEGKALVDLHKPDVVFLDINMPVLDGFDFLNEFDDRNFAVVFVSAFDEYGIKAVRAGAADYLLKPINIKELKQTITRLLFLQNKKIKNVTEFETDKLVVPASHGFQIIYTEDIIRFEGDGCYTKVFIKDQKSIIVSRTLKEFESAVSRIYFYRVHKSHLINLNYIKNYSNIDGGYVIMEDGSKVEISRRKTPEFMLKIKEYFNTV